MIPLKLAAARWALAAKRPYVASVLWALTPVERPGLGTLAVDQYGRLYYDPDLPWEVPDLAGVLYHEVWHLLSAHHDRLRRWPAAIANLSGDLEINSRITRGERDISLPDPVLPGSFGLPDGLLGEEYAELLSQNAPDASGSPESGASGSEPSDASGSQGSGASGPQDSGASGQKGSGASGQEPEASGSRPDASGSRPDASGSQPGASGGRPEASSQDAAGRQSGASGARPGASGERPSCGSCATGRREPWEEGPPGESSLPGLSEAEIDLLRRAVAEEIARQQSQSRGSVPDSLVRWAEAILRPPKVDWRRRLAALVRQSLADVAGASDYARHRPSRRQSASPHVVLPALRQPVPEVAIVIDTSGSMGGHELSAARAEVEGILRACGVRGATVLAVDAAVHSVRREVSARRLRLAGGGGTDMGVGLEAAARLRPRPSVAIVLTDGYTPWPDRPPAGMRVIVALLGGGNAPRWATSVRVEAR